MCYCYTDDVAAAVVVATVIAIAIVIAIIYCYSYVSFILDDLLHI